MESVFTRDMSGYRVVKEGATDQQMETLKASLCFSFFFQFVYLSATGFRHALFCLWERGPFGAEGLCHVANFWAHFVPNKLIRMNGTFLTASHFPC